MAWRMIGASHGPVYRGKIPELVLCAFPHNCACTARFSLNRFTACAREQSPSSKPEATASSALKTRHKGMETEKEHQGVLKEFIERALSLQGADPNTGFRSYSPRQLARSQSIRARHIAQPGVCRSQVDGFTPQTLNVNLRNVS